MKFNKWFFQERDAIQEKLSDLLEENTQLQLQNKTSSNRDNTGIQDDLYLSENSGMDSGTIYRFRFVSV